MLHECLKDYVNDIIVKSREISQHIDEVFLRSRQFNLRMNPLNCAFAVSSGKFLGFTVNRQGIDLDPAKPRPSRRGASQDSQIVEKLFGESSLHPQIPSNLA